MSEQARPHAVIVAGPNGAGKSTLAPRLLAEEFNVDIYVNADVIAQGLAGFDPGSIAVRAGRIMLSRIEELSRERASFAVESTIAGSSLNAFAQRLKTSFGYAIHLVYLWLPDPAIAVARVRARVALGGHDIPEADIRRRYYRGLANFERLYRRTADFWRVYQAVTPPAGREMQVIASGEAERMLEVVDVDAWNELQRQSRLRPPGDTG